MVKKLTQLAAVAQVMELAIKSLTLKEIVKRASVLTGKPLTEDAAQRKLREFEKTSDFLVMAVKSSRGAIRYKAILGPVELAGIDRSPVLALDPTAKVPPTPAVTLPAVAPAPNPGVPTPARKPGANPITFGRPSSNVTAAEKKAEEAPAGKVAGSRSALAFIETLQ